MSIRTVGITVRGTSQLRRITSYLIEHSMWFQVEPLPEDGYTIRWKEGEPIDVLKLRRIEENPEAISWWAMYAKPDGTVGYMGYNGDTNIPYFVQADCIAQLNLLTIHGDHVDDEFYMLHVYPDGHIHIEQWMGDVGEPSERPNPDIRQEVEDYATRLVDAGDMAAFKEVFDSADPNFDVGTLDEERLQEIYDEYIEED